LNEPAVSNGVACISLSLVVVSGTKEGMVQIIWDGNNTKDKPQTVWVMKAIASPCKDSRIAASIVGDDNGTVHCSFLSHGIGLN